MPFYQIVVLAIIQGLTEFLPISSSGHLVLVPEVLGWQNQGLEMDVAVHMGTLGAVLLYFWKDVLQMIRGFFKLVQGKVDDGGRMALQLSIATIPAVIFGLLLSHYGINSVRTLKVIGWTTVIYGVVLFLADRLGSLKKNMKDMTAPKAVLVGIAQALALIPGTSRSGICMTMCRFLGFERKAAARFAFLMSIPAILAAGTHTGAKMVMEGKFTYFSDIAYGAGIALIAGLFAINFMMKWLQRSNFTPFVLYRLCLGAGLLTWAYIT